MLKINVKAAHYIVHRHLSLDVIRRNVMKMSNDIERMSFIRAVALLEKFEPRTHSMDKDEENQRVFDPILHRCCVKDRIILRGCITSGFCVSKTRPSSACLYVEPTMKIGTFRSLVKLYPWVPENNDNSTFVEYGFGQQNILLACMGGSFPLTVVYCGGEFVVPISSCLEKLGELKEKIHQMTGHPPEEQRLEYQMKAITWGDESRLVAFGIVRRYGSNMPPELGKISLTYRPKGRRDLD